MKYFVNAEERAASGHENYIEFQLPAATDDFWDNTSLYMLETTMHETEFYEFWNSFGYDGMIFINDSFSKDELTQISAKAAEYGGTILEIISELKDWVDAQNTDVIHLIWACDRELARRRDQRDDYPVDPHFYEEVKTMYEQHKDVPLTEYFATTEEAYEKLLRKYNMPNCFFPFPLYESNN